MWDKYSVGDLCETISDTYHRHDENVILINTSDVLEGKVKNHQKVKNTNIKGQFKKTFRKNDILYSEIRPANKRYAFIDFDDTEQYIASTKLMVLRAKEQIVLPRFLLAFLSSKPIIAKLQQLAETRSGTFPQITFSSEIAPLPILIPDLKTQEHIIDFLGCFDDKIEVNNKIIKNVTEQINLLFSYYTSKSGSSRVSLTEIIDVKGGGTPNTQTPEYWSGGIPFFTPKDANALFVTETDKTISKIGLENCNSRLYEKGTVFVTARGTVGKIAIAGKSMAMNQSCYALIGDGIGQELVYFYAKSAISSLKNKANGAVFDAIVTRDFKSESIIRMASSLEADFEKKAKLYFDEILTLQNQNMALNELRDSLLPRLISGEIDLKNL